MDKISTENNIFIKLLPIKTERLEIKKTSINDIDLLLKMDKQEETQKYLGGVKNKTREERLEFLKKKENNSSSLTVYLNNIPIGFIGLKNNSELSYIFDYDYWHKGYCTESCRELINIAFNKFNIRTINANTIKENINSIKVLERLGFTFKEIKNKEDNIFLNYIISNKN